MLLNSREKAPYLLLVEARGPLRARPAPSARPIEGPRRSSRRRAALVAVAVFSSLFALWAVDNEPGPDTLLPQSCLRPLASSQVLLPQKGDSGDGAQAVMNGTAGVRDKPRLSSTSFRCLRP